MLLDLHLDEELLVLAPARRIADNSMVTKKGGSVPYRLRRKITVYPVPKSDAKPVVLEGLYLVNDRGDINQVDPETMLVVTVSLDQLGHEWQEIEFGHEDK